MIFLQIVKAFLYIYIGLHSPHINETCPDGMTSTGVGSCIDIYPIGASEDTKPTLSLSGLPEDYIDLKGKTWDLKSICESQNKRMCSLNEWTSACRGTKKENCPPLKSYIVPNWDLVARRDKKELERLNQYSTPNQYPLCKSNTGARMMLNSAQEWVSYGINQYVLTRGYWSRPGQCDSINTAHSPRWHDYATTGRCCVNSTSKQSN